MKGSGKMVVDMKYKKINKKAQIWSFDLIIAGVIFLMGIIILFLYAINYTSQAENELDELFYQGNLASELILSEEDFGILTNGKVDSAKLTAFDCSIKKNEMFLRNNFYFSLSGINYCDVLVDFIVIKCDVLRVYDADISRYCIVVYYCSITSIQKNINFSITSKFIKCNVS